VKIIAIAAVGKNGVIGKGSELPWHIPEDMKFFRDSTRGHAVVMGRKTYEALGKALPGRENAVITRNPEFKPADARVFDNLKAAIESLRPGVEASGKDLFVIGGAEIYALSFPFLDGIWLTEIDADFEGDVFFPSYENGQLRVPGFRPERRLPKQDLSGSPYAYRFVYYSRSAE
jgi:dihydrofolate reductase